MKRFLLTAIIIFFAAAGAAQARIGETFEECQQRYGILQRVDVQYHPEFPQNIFRHGDVEIRVRFHNGRSAQEIYSGADGKKLQRAQIDEILAANRESKVRTKWDIDYARSERSSDILIITELEFDKVWRKDSGSGF
jgi:hypothetical protein